MRTSSALIRTQRVITSLVALTLAIFLLSLFGTASHAAPPANSNAPGMSTIIVKFAPGLSSDDHQGAITRNGGTKKGEIGKLGLHIIEVPTAQRDAMLAKYKKDSQVSHAEPNRQRQSDRTPSDALYASQWGLPKIGWDTALDMVGPTGTAKVAVLDTGIDATHPDLSGKVVAGTSILDGSSGMSDANGHGTWVAGIIAAQVDNGEGIAGVSFAGVSVMPVTVLDANGLGQDSDVIQGVLWAADNGADVIVMAFSNPDFSQSLQDAIDYASNKGVVLVAAAGNDA